MKLFIALNSPILLAAITGLIRYKAAGRAWRPFLAMLWLGSANDILSVILIKTIHDNTVNGNIYTLIEYFLLLWQFYFWSPSKRALYLILGCVGVAVWLLDNLVLHSLHQDNSMFRAFYGFIVVFLAIGQVNRQITGSNIPLRNNAVVIVCFGFLFYYGCRSFTEVFPAFGVAFSDSFEINLFIIMAAVNCITNFIYTTALICLPTKQRFLWPSPYA